MFFLLGCVPQGYAFGPVCLKKMYFKNIFKLCRRTFRTPVVFLGLHLCYCAAGFNLRVSLIESELKRDR